MCREMYRRTVLTEVQAQEMDGFAVNEKEHVIYVLEFKPVSDAGERYVTETQRVAELQHLAVTQILKKLLKNTQWTVEQLSFVAGHKSVIPSLGVSKPMTRPISKFGVSSDDRLKIRESLGRTLSVG